MALLFSSLTKLGTSTHVENRTSEKLYEVLRSTDSREKHTLLWINDKLSKEENKMMNFLMITFGVAVGITLSMVVTTIILFVLMSNAKVMGWVMKHYMKMLNKSFENFEKVIDDYEGIEA